jgi:hypothetical protein
MLQDMEDQVLQCMFYLCRISRKRQEKAATAGLVPYLQRYYMYNNMTYIVLFTAWLYLSVLLHLSDF